MGRAWIVVVAALLVVSCGSSEASRDVVDPPDRAELVDPTVTAESTATTAPVAPTTASGSSRVAAPVAPLEPITSTPVDPESVGIEWDGSKYKVPAEFTWDESQDGGHLLFDRGRVLITGDGVSISGAVFAGIDSGNNSVVQAGEGVGPFTLRRFLVDRGSGSAAVGGSIGRGNGSTISNFSIVGFDGDGIKPPIGSTITDGLVHLRQRSGSELHYDGVQITGRSNITLSRLRFRLEGNDNLNAAVFIHEGNNGEVSENNTITDIDIEHAAYSWFPIRLNSGSVMLRDVVGRGPVSADGRRPAALVLHAGQAGIDWDRVWADFDGDVDLARRQ